MQKRFVALLAGAAFVAPILGAMVLAQPEVRAGRDAFRFEMAALANQWLGGESSEDAAAGAYAQALAESHEAAAIRAARAEHAQAAAEAEAAINAMPPIDAIPPEHAIHARAAVLAQAEAVREMARARIVINRERIVTIREQHRAMRIERELRDLRGLDHEALEEKLQELEELHNLDDDCADLDISSEDEALSRYWRLPSGDGALRYRHTPL